MHQILVISLVSMTLSPAIASIISTQFHAQDGYGGYSYGHSGGPSSKFEQRTPDGTVTGSYSYVDGNGFIQTARYTADPVNGFRVQASNLPVSLHPAVVSYAPLSAPVDRPLGVPVVDTPEVVAARIAHLAAVEQQKQIIASYPSRQRRSVLAAYSPFVFNYAPELFPAHRPLGVPVVDTPEVAAAKIAHLSAVEDQKLIIASHQ